MKFLSIGYLERNLPSKSDKEIYPSGRGVAEASALFLMVPWRIEVYLAEMVWEMLGGWLSSCIAVADDVARALRSGDISVV
ncbi:hypothetical protein ACP70R_005211 [Stipagrostis hirtigluma subsp. patula]